MSHLFGRTVSAQAVEKAARGAAATVEAWEWAHPSSRQIEQAARHSHATVMAVVEPFRASEILLPKASRRVGFFSCAACAPLLAAFRCRFHHLSLTAFTASSLRLYCVSTALSSAFVVTASPLPNP